MTPAYLRHRDGFEKAMDPRLFTIEWLDQQVADGLATCFGNEDAAVLVKIVEYPTGTRILHGIYAVGPVTEIKKLVTIAEQWGAEFGASLGMISSRRAWAKLMPDYTEYKVEIMKELHNGQL